MHLEAIPDRAALRELKRPWKLATFAIAMALLLYGALNFEIGDWDVGVTLLMGTLTYALAPSGARALARALRERSLPAALDGVIALALAWFVIDGAYMAWHLSVGNPIYRADNAMASTPIYGMAGLFWLYRGSLRELLANLRALR
ncbi:MAG: hypothetical protein U1F26_06665 [Lysobacterales bacterium]